MSWLVNVVFFQAIMLCIICGIFMLKRNKRKEYITTMGIVILLLGLLN